jgi:DNA-binding SARP family transcriptional activator/CheY-like chemotaxis protein
MDTLRPPRFRLALLGTFALTGPDGPVDLPSKKLGGLLAYLALTEPAPQPRDKLVALFWGSHFEVQARQNLRKALFRLRQALGPDALVSVGEAISLAPGLIGCDAARLQALIREGSRASLAEAAGLYNGRLLSDVNVTEDAWNEWLQPERQRVETLAVDAMVALGEQELHAGNYEQALEAAARAVAVNALREDAHRVILKALAATGRKAEALKRYEDVVALLKRELNTEPDPATTSLAAELRSTQPAGAAPSAPQPEPRDDGEPSMKVLIVDDHALIRDALHTVFNQLERKTVVFKASNSREATRIVEEHPDLALILLDINLPDRDGFSVLSELRDRHTAISVIILSASDDQDSVKRAFKLGALGFIPKTTEREVMLSAIKLVLSGGVYIPTEMLKPE